MRAMIRRLICRVFGHVVEDVVIEVGPTLDTMRYRITTRECRRCGRVIPLDNRPDLAERTTAPGAFLAREDERVEVDPRTPAPSPR